MLTNSGVRRVNDARMALLGGVIAAALTACSGGETPSVQTFEAPPSTTSAPTPATDTPPATTDESAESDQPGTADSPPAEPRSMETAVVVNIVDGDTFDVQHADGTTNRVRPPQVDTPERGECGFDESTWAAEEHLLGNTVGLTPTTFGPDSDPYDRLLRAVDIDGQDFGELLLHSGLARWSENFADEDPGLAADYAVAEDLARSEGHGLWSMCGW